MGLMKGLSLEFNISKKLRKQVQDFTGKGKNVIMKRGLAKASTVSLKQLKVDVRVLRKESKDQQSTGATERGLVSKAVFPSQGNPNYGYAYTGVSMKYRETVSKNPHDFSGAGKVRAHIKNARIAGTGQLYNPKSGRVRVRAVKGYQKKIRHSTKSSVPKGTQLSRPGKYWHLLNEGFQHRGGKTVAGRKFAESVTLGTDHQMLVAFNKEFEKLIK